MRKSISLKIFSIALVILVMMAIATGISTVQLNKVSDEAIELAHYYIPVEQKVQWAARHASAELIHFERYLKLLDGSGAPERQRDELAKMQERSRQVDEAIADALKVVAKGRADTSVNVDPVAFALLEKELPHIAAAHATMRGTIEKYLRERAANSERSALVLDELLAEQRAKISAEILDVTQQLEALTLDSANQALDLERQAALMTWGITVATIVIGLVLATVITRALVRPVRSLVAGTEAVQRGNLDVEIKVDSSDEMATLADSFNHMVGGLKQKEAIRTTFGKYVDPRIVQNLLEDQAFSQGGQRRRMTVFFSDLAGFTSLCEDLTPDGVVRFLNHYFNLMSDPIRRESGVIDKFIGDAIMAFWGPPFSAEAEHPVQACRAALDQLPRLEEFRRTMPDLLGPSRGAPDVNVRIGIATGDATVGSIGSDTVKGYTVIGDTVNLAARLESVNKQYGTSILISEDTWKSARDHVEVRELDIIRVAGKSESARIFELIGMKGGAPADRLAMRDAYERAFGHYRSGDLARARSGFEECLGIDPHDRAVQLFLARVATMEAQGLPHGWDGVWTMTNK